MTAEEPMVSEIRSLAPWQARVGRQVDKLIVNKCLTDGLLFRGRAPSGPGGTGARKAPGPGTVPPMISNSQILVIGDEFQISFTDHPEFCSVKDVRDPLFSYFVYIFFVFVTPVCRAG